MQDINSINEKLRNDLCEFDRSIQGSRRMYESFIREATNKNDPKYLARSKEKLEQLEQDWKRQRQEIIDGHSKWAESNRVRESDFDFLCGRGLFYMATEMSFKQSRIWNVNTPTPTVGYVEIHQWWIDDIVSGTTKFADLFQKTRTLRWWRKSNDIEPTIGHGMFLYQIKLGGVLELVGSNPDSSD